MTASVAQSSPQLIRIVNLNQADLNNGCLISNGDASQFQIHLIDPINHYENHLNPSNYQKLIDDSVVNNNKCVTNEKKSDGPNDDEQIYELIDENPTNFNSDSIKTNNTTTTSFVKTFKPVVLK
jgi:hypothetical protein